MMSPSRLAVNPAAPVVRVPQRQHIGDEIVRLPLAQVEIHLRRIIVRAAQPGGERLGGQPLLVGDGREGRRVRVRGRAVAADRMATVARRLGERLARQRGGRRAPGRGGRRDALTRRQRQRDAEQVKRL